MIAVKQRMTEAEFMKMPDDGYRYELVDGEPKRMATNQKHDHILSNLHIAVWPFAKGRGGIGLGQAGFRMVTKNIRVPDFAFTLKERVSDMDAFGDAAPDFCVEIISPSEESEEMARKVREYFASGAQVVWQMFSETDTIKVYASPEDSIIYNSEDEIDCPELLPGFRITVAKLFALE